jgi:hypothetical protein
MDEFEQLACLVEEYVDEINSVDPDCIDDKDIGINTGNRQLDIKDLALMMRCSDIILDCRNVKYDYKYRRKYSLEQSDKMVEEFLENLNPEYLNYYRLRKEDGTIVFDKKSHELAYQFYDAEVNKGIIYVPVTFTLEDSYTIIHELFHDINCSYTGSSSVGRHYLTEGLSFLGELLFSEFLKSRNIKEVNHCLLKSMETLKLQSLIVNFELRLVLEYLKNGYIDEYVVSNIFWSYSTEYYDDLFNIIISACYDEEINLDQMETYVLSYLVAIYMYDRIKSNNKNLDELFDLNQILDDLSIEQVLEYLGIDYDDVTLTSKSYEMLRSGLTKFMKR